MRRRNYFGRIPRVVWGLDDPKRGGATSKFTILDDGDLNHRPTYESGLLKEECQFVIQDFSDAVALNRKSANKTHKTIMNKAEILEQIIAHLQANVDVMKKAEAHSHSVATDKENQPKSKYETLALESSYLAQVQGDRVNEMESVLQAYCAFRNEIIEEGGIIRLSALVSIEEKWHQNSTISSTKTGGWAGLELDINGETLTVITSASPIGQALLGQKSGDIIKVKIGWNERTLKISAVS